jgi:DNA-binding NarL/FixJ family response regulator
MRNDQKIRLLVADDQEIVRLGLKALFADTEIKVTAEAVTGQSAIKQVREKEFDAALLDVRMPDSDGLIALAHIKQDKPDLPVIMFSAFDNPASVARAVAIGANGFLLKSCGREELLRTIRAVVAGENVWTEEGLRSLRVVLRMRRADKTLEVSLSERETTILAHIAAGMTNKQIATAMQLGYETIKMQLLYLFDKIGVKGRTQAALWAVQNELV